MPGALRRFVGRLTLLAFVSSLLVPVVTASHLAGEDDPACSPESVAAGHRTAQLEDRTPPSTARHCAVCHWLRAMATATTRTPVVLLNGLASRPAAPAEHTHFLGALLPSGFTTRGPPAKPA
jgi:hypothetical protein